MRITIQRYPTLASLPKQRFGEDEINLEEDSEISQND
jgi:hypothetical protein